MRPRVGISACLLGEAVRYDGAHKRDAFLVEALGAHVEWVPVCPEVELGLGVPREPIRLEGGAGGRGGALGTGDVRLVTVTTRRDLTAAMAAFAPARVAALAAEGLAGWVLKARSPSCGPAGVPIEGSDRTGPGAFAREVRERLPHLPVAHEEALARPAAREAFVAAVFTLARWQAAAIDATPDGLERLRAFAAQHRLLLASRDERAAGDIDALLAQAAPEPPEVLLRVMAAMGRVPSPGDHLLALRAALATRRPRPTVEVAAGLAHALDRYEHAASSLGATLEEIRHLLAPGGADALLGQAYFAPHPRELRLLDGL
jgi:uncharacterized protein YbbK (DUF523 family)/uncharacterized protein YbgA (DUF1722 family)